MRSRPRAAVLAALPFVLSGRLSAAILGFDRAADAFQPAPDGFHLVEETPPAAPAPAEIVSAPPRLFDRKTSLATAGVLVGAPIVGYFAWWRTSSRSTFELANERWFQRDTYAGGADKASHVFLGYISTLALQNIYRSLDKTPAQARGLALGVMVAAGVLIEIGDGFSQYGFAWEDIAANAVGAMLATGLDAWGLKDTVGLRFGYVKALVPDPCCRYGGYGDDYSKEIYSADLKLGGLLPRIGARPGPARFLLLSVTYGTKGYRYSAEPLRQRNVGFELGLNLRDILVAVGIPEKPWWGKVLLGIATYFRFPYTSFGWHYDLNHGTWSGPDTGDHFDPGSIIYD
ncbi:MAG TPA: DUF2279 domain-containing protein [Thermoanaerobaculia bacterium]|nr:DUF2279 domain-containing protein [Thermoanaerobaculia bacterium]